MPRISKFIQIEKKIYQLVYQMAKEYIISQLANLNKNWTRNAQG